MKGVAQSRILTDEERRATLLTRIASKLSEPGKLHLPTARTYNQLGNNQGLQDLHNEFCKWLGLKHGRLQVRYAQTNSFTLSETSIEISEAYKLHPYSAATLLCFATLSQYLTSHIHTTPSRADIEFASIETGLGLWVLNGLQPKMSRSQSLYHFMDNSWVHHEGITLSDYVPSYYASKLSEYAHEHRIPSEEYLGHVNKRARHLLPPHIRSSLTPSLPDPDAMHMHTRASKLLWTKIALIAVTLALITCFSTYFYTARQPITNAERLELEKSLQIIKNSYDACVAKANEQQSSYDPNDLFMTRQIDATRAKCESLRNEYNYALDQYQAALQR